MMMRMQFQLYKARSTASDAATHGASCSTVMKKRQVRTYLMLLRTVVPTDTLGEWLGGDDKVKTCLDF